MDIIASQHHDVDMRTTLQLDDDVYVTARALADARHISLGAALSELARQGLAARAPMSRRSGFPVFPVPEGAPPITGEMVSRALDEE